MALEDKAKQLAELKQRGEQVDSDAERDWWLAELHDLYDNVEAWLGPLQQKGFVVSRRIPIQLVEEGIGDYNAEELILEFGPEAIILQPKGTLIVGARGKVDVFRRGSRGEHIMLILSGAKETPHWEIWPSRDPRQRKPLEQASFEELLENLLEV
jgi:hypothetical protein